ncbi:putative carboxylesterase [Xylogone sp. PMI_703]|nr:putative carboxylesterase [Xylogone sp. PMI_703]
MAPLVIINNPASPAILQQRTVAMDRVEDTWKSQTQWYETETVAHYRRMRIEGSNGFVKPQLYDGAQTIFAHTRDGHSLGLRIISPDTSSKGVMLHFHAGGFCIGSAQSYDNYLLHLATALNLTAVSVEYRLAPENPYPTSHYDCLDAAIFALSSEGEEKLGGPLKILMGESAGGSLAVWVALALRDECGEDVQSKIAAILPSCGIFDMTYTPSLLNHTRDAILSRECMERYVDASMPSHIVKDRKHPKISSLYDDLSEMPPALFLVGTEDPLLDDSIFMATKWHQAGNDTSLCIIPGAWHAFTLVPSAEAVECTDEGLSELVKFAKRYL